MIIRRIEIRNFRKLVGPLIIKDIGDGLSIIVGDNEEGKSTLLQAIRSGFFDKHNMTGERADSLQPYNSALRPEVLIEFDVNDGRYTLLKAFCQHPEAELVTPRGRLTGSAAEEELERLLRFTRPKRARRESDREHEGMFGMFWVEQGRSFIGVDVTEDSRASILQALQQQVGDVLGGKRGKAILAEVTRLRSQLFTATGRPRGEYAEAMQGVLNVEEEVRKAEQQLTEYDGKVEELERCRAKLQRYALDNSVAQAGERLAKADVEKQEIDALRRAREDAKAAVGTATTRQQLAVSKWDERQSAIRTVEAERRKVAQLKDALSEKQMLLTRLQERLGPEEKAAAEAARRFEDADQEFIAASAGERAARVQAELQRLQQGERAVMEAKSAQERALLAANGIAIEKKHVAHLKRYEDGVNKAQAQLDAAATNVTIKLEPGIKARFGPSAITSEIERRITETTVLHIAKCAEITIIPGGDVGNPRVELERQTQALRQALAKLGVSSAVEADAKADQRIRYLSEAEKHAELIEVHAPGGFEALQVKIRDLQAELAQQIRVAGMPPKSVREATDALNRIGQERDKADHDAKAGRRRLNQITQELNEARQQEATCKATYQSEVDHVETSEALLKSAREKTEDAYLQQAVIHAAQAVKTADLTLQATEKAFDDADAESVERELNMAREALKQIQADVRRQEEKSIRLETELRTTGATGLGERKQELEAELEVARAIAARFERRGRTVELLYSALTEAELTARETFLQPIAERVHPYLRLLLPGTELRMNEEMDIVGLQRGAVEEKFECLSLGTREQLAVLTRLAFADLMREQGQPAAVLLDDAIVFADDQRFGRMLHILQKAAKRLQIIVLTCRERDYQGAGAPITRLADCIEPKVAPAVP